MNCCCDSETYSQVLRELGQGDAPRTSRRQRQDSLTLVGPPGLPPIPPRALPHLPTMAHGISGKDILSARSLNKEQVCMCLI